MNIEPEVPFDSADSGADKEPGKKSRFGLILAGLALVLLLGSAAYMAGKYLNRRAAGGAGPAGLAGPGGGASAGARVGASAERSIQLEIKPAEELPETEPDVAGVFVRREDNSVFIGTGKLTMTMSANQGGSPSDMDSSYDGPVVEVVITGDTQIYQDDSLSGMDEPPTGGVIQQKVAPGSIEEIGENSGITAWGRKVGDRLIAEVLLYSSPVIMSMPGN